MSKNELHVLRANLLGGMDAYIRGAIDDEDYLMEWLEMGVPDEADEDTLMEIAEDEEEFNRISAYFGSLIGAFAKEYGLGD